MQLCLLCKIIIIISILSRFLSTCWMRTHFHDNLSKAFCFHVTDFQKTSTSSLYLFDFSLWIDNLQLVSTSSLRVLSICCPPCVLYGRQSLFTCLDNVGDVANFVLLLAYSFFCLSVSHQLLVFPLFFGKLPDAVLRLWLVSMFLTHRLLLAGYIDCTASPSGLEVHYFYRQLCTQVNFSIWLGFVC